MSGRLHLRMLWHKPQVVELMQWGKMVYWGMRRLIQSLVLWTSVCSSYNDALDIVFNIFMLCCVDLSFLS